ncbi:MAG: hypothetical protein HJJLKODD_01771 [Phycisphaerae bacterium]|nr:hypothetical protein [Phycisphaerae bacterium]
MTNWKIGIFSGVALLGSYVFLRIVGQSIELQHQNLIKEKIQHEDAKRKADMMIVATATPIGSSTVTTISPGDRFVPSEITKKIPTESTGKKRKAI